MFNLFKDTRLEDAQVRLRTLENNPPKVNNILHLILSILTGGLWLIVWALQGMSTPSIKQHTLQIIKLENDIEALKNERVAK